MDIEVISYILALIVGGLSFALVKHTADEYDRWYEQPTVRGTLRVRTAMLSIALVGTSMLLIGSLIR
jgi:hypothetical protein